MWRCRKGTSGSLCRGHGPRCGGGAGLGRRGEEVVSEQRVEIKPARPPGSGCPTTRSGPRPDRARLGRRLVEVIDRGFVPALHQLVTTGLLPDGGPPSASPAQSAVVSSTWSGVRPSSSAICSTTTVCTSASSSSRPGCGARSGGGRARAGGCWPLATSEESGRCRRPSRRAPSARPRRRTRRGPGVAAALVEAVPRHRHQLSALASRPQRGVRGSGRTPRGRASPVRGGRRCAGTGSVVAVSSPRECREPERRVDLQYVARPRESCRPCSRSACGRPAINTLTYVYGDQSAVSSAGHLRRAPAYDLCELHSERRSRPRGWEVLRLAPDPYAQYPAATTCWRWPTRCEAGRPAPAPVPLHSTDDPRAARSVAPAGLSPRPTDPP